MKNNRIHFTRGLRACLVLPLMALFWMPTMSTNAQSNELSTAQAGQHSMMGQGMMQSQMNERGKAMTGPQKNMQMEMKSSDAKLDKLIAAMNEATGTNKVDAIAAVINYMAGQNKEMQHRMLEMQSQMMQSTPVQKPAGAQSPESCPMMKDMTGGGMMGKQNTTPQSTVHKSAQ
jgi:hypothetical protein